MSSVDALTRRVSRLQGRTSTARLEEQWELLCAGSRDALLAKLSRVVKDDPQEAQPIDKGWLEEFLVMLAARAEETKQAWMRLHR